jgi:endonuclease-8
MPEGPEIRIAADRVAGAVKECELEDVYFEPARLKDFADELRGQCVIDITTRGKAMLTTFSNGLTMYSHNQLYGRWNVRARGQIPNTGRTLRVALHTAAHSALLYSATDIEVLDQQGLRAHPFLNRIGPDILDPSLDVPRIVERLIDRRFAGRSLASLYLDQAFLAGNGNYLRSEILFISRLAWQRRPKELDDAERERLAEQTLAIAQRSYKTKGITNLPAIVKARKLAGYTGKESYRFAVFGRDGLPCDECGAKIERTQVGSRRLYYCPTCQA